MAKVHYYEVWTYGAAGLGAQLFTGNKWQCNAYIRQAVKKGANPRHFTIKAIFYPRKRG